MRTGSNLLERLINQYDGLHCHGELFNHAFIGKEGRQELLGLSMADREAEPQRIIAALIAERKDEVPGFRIFDGHDQRILDAALKDPECGRVILRRSAIDSYVSLKIARKTDQWMLGNINKRKTAQIEFDAAEYDAFCAQQAGYYARLRSTMSAAGQTAFELTYADLKDINILNGLASFLGSSERHSALEEPIKQQNPEPLHQKVTNYDDLLVHLAGSEPSAGSSLASNDVPTGRLLSHISACPSHGLIYAHLPGTTSRSVLNWMEALGDTKSGFNNQKAVSKWQEEHGRGMSFSIVRHPVERAYHTFCHRILNDGQGSFPHIRQRLANHHNVVLPGATPLNVAETQASFEAFCVFLKANVAGQTGVRIDNNWMPQDSLLESYGALQPIRRVLFSDEVAAFCAGYSSAAPPQLGDPNGYPPLQAVYSKRIENLARAAYGRDYRKFGFGAWSGSL